MLRANTRTRLLLLAAVMLSPSTAGAYDCIELKCTEMSTCAEAHYKFAVCGHTKRDADNDGIPCEDLCGKDIKTYTNRHGAQTTKPADASASKTEPKSKSKANADAQLTPAIDADEVPDPDAADVSAAGDFTCSGKRTCKQMDSCDEAKFYLAKCGVKSLDGDRDGVPCNALCR